MRYIDACQNQEWSVATWGRADGEDPRVRPYRCGSWRHEGDCRAACGACDFARIMQALSEHTNWTYFVFTYPCREWKSAQALYRFGLHSWGALRKRIVRKFGKILYIQTWEMHRNGKPHVNVVISNPEISRLACENYRALRREWFIPNLVDIGFGRRCWIKPLYDQERLAGYLTKLGLELHGATNKDQIPINAPKHFRRLRASVRLLPKRFRDDTITGQLFKLPFDQANRHFEGTGTVPLSNLKPSQEKPP
jgi:hypothetical protein